MPLYLCNAAKGAISDAAKPKIAADITRIHCEVTGAPPQFVHAFFVEEDGVGGPQSVFFPAVVPIVHFDGRERNSV